MQACGGLVGVPKSARVHRPVSREKPDSGGALWRRIDYGALELSLSALSDAADRGAGGGQLLYCEAVGLRSRSLRSAGVYSG